jgi:hypothetical protein
MKRLSRLAGGVLALAVVAVVVRDGGAKSPDGNPLFQQIPGLEILRGREHRALLVVPLAAPAADPADTKAFDTAAGATTTDQFNIAEPQKNQGRHLLDFYNWSTAPVLVLGGTVLSGGTRDRYVSGSFLVGAGTQTAARVLPADREALEPGQASRLLAPEPFVVPHLLRVVGLAGGSAAAVDAFIEEVYALAGLDADRQPLATLYRLGPVAEKMKEYLPFFAGLPAEADARVVGAAIYVGDRFLSVDLFGRNADFRANWPAILAGAAFEASAFEVSYGLVNAPFPAARDPERVREDVGRILRRPLGTAHREEKPVGEGREFSFRRDDLVGRTLALPDGMLVHAVILRDALSEPEPPPPNVGGTPSEETPGDLERRAERGRLTEFEKRLLDRMRSRRGLPAGD